MHRPLKTPNAPPASHAPAGLFHRSRLSRNSFGLSVSLICAAFANLVGPISTQAISFDILARQAFVESHGQNSGGTYVGPSSDAYSTESGIFHENHSTFLNAIEASGSATAVANHVSNLQLSPGALPGVYEGLYFAGEASASSSAQIAGEFGSMVSAQAVVYLTLRFFLDEPTPFFFSASTDHSDNSGGGGGVYFWLNSLGNDIDLGGNGINVGPESSTLSGTLAPGGHLIQAMIHVGAHAIAFPSPSSADESGSFSFRFGLGTLTALASNPEAVPEGGSTFAFLFLSIVGLASVSGRKHKSLQLLVWMRRSFRTARNRNGTIVRGSLCALLGAAPAVQGLNVTFQEAGQWAATQADGSLQFGVAAPNFTGDFDHQLNGITTHSDVSVLSTAFQTTVLLNGTIDLEARGHSGQITVQAFFTIDAPAYLSASGTIAGNMNDENAATSIWAETASVLSTSVDHWGHDAQRGTTPASFANPSAQEDILTPSLVPAGSYYFAFRMNAVDLATDTAFNASGTMAFYITAAESIPDSGSSGILLAFGALLLVGVRIPRS